MKIRHQRLVMFVCSPRAKKKGHNCWCGLPFLCRTPPTVIYFCSLACCTVAAAAGLKTPGYDHVRFYRHFNGIHYRSVEIHRYMREMLHSLKTWVCERGKNTGQCLCFWFWFLLFLYQCLYGTNRSDCNDVAAAKQPVWRVYWCLGTWLLVSDKPRLVSMHLGILTYGVAIVTMSLHDISIICTNFYGIIMAVPCDDNFVCVAPLVGM